MVLGRTLPEKVLFPWRRNEIGAVLTQRGQPIAYMSRSLGLAKRNWSTYAREMLAIVVSIRTWRPYLMEHKFIIQTDQRSLRYLLEQRILTPEQQKWAGKMAGYDYEIVYKPGRNNAAADALSRVPNNPSLNAISTSHAALWDDLRSGLSLPLPAQGDEFSQSFTGSAVLLSQWLALLQQQDYYSPRIAIYQAVIT